MLLDLISFIITLILVSVIVIGLIPVLLFRMLLSSGRKSRHNKDQIAIHEGLSLMQTRVKNLEELRRQ